MKVLVTGGGGFIGSHLAERLLVEGHEVRILDNFATGVRANVAALGDVELIEGDILSHERASAAVHGCQVVFHLAALPSVPRSVRDPLASHASNVTGVLNVLLAARDEGVGRVIFASSSSVYGPYGDLPRREGATPLPISPYAVAKLAGEGYCRSFSSVYGLDTVCLRYFNVFGPRQDPSSQYAAVIPNFILALLRGRSPTIFGDGEQSRDFTYVENVVDANILAMEAGVADGRIYNAACGHGVSLNRLFAELSGLLDSSTPAVYAEARPGDIRHSHADIARAGEELGYRPSVDLHEGLLRTIEHLERTTAERRLFAG